VGFFEPVAISCSKVVLVKCATPGGVPQAKHLAGERIAISLSNHKLFYFNKQTLEIYSCFSKMWKKCQLWLSQPAAGHRCQKTIYMLWAMGQK